MIQGLRTVIYPVTDLKAGIVWYSDVLGVAPYFDEPYYAGFNVGGFELGLIPDGEPGSTGAQAYWGTPDAAAEGERLVALGATIASPIQDVGGGIRVLTVLDPFGNLFGVIENPQFDLTKIS
ncbi:MAG: VOC family protein [Pseudomonadota bacterium]|nr:VOC family protein [Pseudomonadota bacterium]